MLHISHRERVEGHPHAGTCSCTAALERHHNENRDDGLPGQEYRDASSETPVRVLQAHVS
jgi:hypothetical protein